MPAASPSTPLTRASAEAVSLPAEVPVPRDVARNSGPLPVARPVTSTTTSPGLSPTLTTTPLLSPRSGVFVAYSHRDRDLLGELQRHLKPLQKAWMLDLWDDLRVDPGPRGATELRRAVDSARVALLLISPGFLASPFVVEHVLPVTLATQPHPRAAVMCLYLRPAMDVFAEYKFRDPHTRDDRSVRITSFHALNDPTYPLAAQAKPARDGILAAAAEEIIAAAHRGTSAPLPEASPAPRPREASKGS